MSREILVKELDPIVWADTTDYAGDGGARTKQIDLTSLGNGAAREGAKADLTATRAARFAVELCVEFVSSGAPESGETVDLYWGPSNNGTAGTANPAGLTGVDAAYTGTAGDSLADSLKQLLYIGSLVLTADVAAVVQRQTFVFSPPTRHGIPVVVNSCNDASEDFHSDAIEMYIRMTPLVDEVQ